jgi:hypothetical protein
MPGPIAGTNWEIWGGGSGFLRAANQVARETWPCNAGRVAGTGQQLGLLERRLGVRPFTSL